jgi:hypothetical protein
VPVFCSPKAPANPELQRWVKDADGPYVNSDYLELARFQRATGESTALIGARYQRAATAAQSGDIGLDAAGLVERVQRDNVRDMTPYLNAYADIRTAAVAQLYHLPPTLNQEVSNSFAPQELGNRYHVADRGGLGVIPAALIADTVQHHWDPKAVGTAFVHEYEHAVHGPDTRSHGFLWMGTVTNHHPPQMNAAEVAKIVGATEADVKNNRPAVAYPAY